MKKIMYLVLFVLLLFLVISCENESIPEKSVNVEVNESEEVVGEVSDNEETITLVSLQTKINEKRIGEQVGHMTIDDFVYQTDVMDFTKEEANRLLDFRPFDHKTITVDQALDDIDTLFRIFKLQYGGYTLFGGDETFDAARVRIEESLVDIDTITSDELESLLLDELSFINDGHMRIGRYGINDTFDMKYYAYEDTAFYKDDQGYFSLEDETKIYLHSLDNQSDLEGFMKLSLDDQGNFVYYIGALYSDDSATLKVKVEYDKNGEMISDEMTLIRSSVLSNRKMKTYEEEVIGDVPVISCRRFYDLDDEIDLKYFVESGKTLKDEDVIILDIRGNTGGSSAWTELWFENYTGQKPKSGVSRITRYASIYRTLVSDFVLGMQGDVIDKYDIPELEELYTSYLETIEEGINSDQVTYLIEETEYNRVDNDPTIFVLVDKAVASSGEDFVMKLMTMDNVVIVGTNTSGSMDVSSNMPMSLPNSDLGVFLGVGIEMQRSAPHFRDGNGIEPDIWISNHKVLDKVLKLIENTNEG